MSNEAKLAELRAKTDDELSRYVASQLERAVGFASESSGGARGRAFDLYDEILRLLPLLPQSTPGEARPLQASFTRLQEMLHRMTVMAGSAC